jgi:hypothetical protein
MEGTDCLLDIQFIVRALCIGVGVDAKDECRVQLWLRKN